MSINAVSLECERCHASFSDGATTGYFVYELDDGSQLQLDRQYGWCHDCDRMVAIEDLSGRRPLEDLKRIRRWKTDAEDQLRRSILSMFKGNEKNRIRELDIEIEELEQSLSFLRLRKSAAKCLTCGSTEIEELPSIPRPAEPMQPVPAGWNHPGCGGRMLAVLQEYRLSYSNSPRIYNKDGLSKEHGADIPHTHSASRNEYPAEEQFATAQETLESEFGITLDTIPEKHSVIVLFTKISSENQLSQESCISLLYRLVAMNFLGACKLMRDSGQNTKPEELLWLTGLLDESINWSESAEDHVALETATSQLNRNIQSFMQSFGIYGSQSST